jgi:molecular chaperone GrpE (heat shock protein)
MSEFDPLRQLDVAAILAEQQEKSRREQRELLMHFIEVIDGAEQLARHCRELRAQGHLHVPADSAELLVRMGRRALRGLGVEPIDCLGAPLDLASHEVVGTRVEPNAAQDVIVEEVLAGYRWRGGILRCAKVVVSVDPAPGERGMRGTQP